MLYSLIRFWFNNWIYTLYIKPTYFFSYYGFDWIKPLGYWTYLIFFLCIVSSIGITLGFKYKFSIISFFILFSYIELMDKTTYLNHYYFIMILSFIMIFLPANSSFSIDSLLSGKSYNFVPKWNIDILKLIISLVYIYAGIAKINYDWLINAQPLKIWLSTKYDIPILGFFFVKFKFIFIIMSWFSMFYDLFIPLLLYFKRTRLFAFILVVIFHILTKVFFPIGVFPFVMIISSMIFFSENFHKKVLNKLSFFLKKIYSKTVKLKYYNDFKNDSKKYRYLLLSFIFLQLLIPFRYLLYNGNILWNEQGYRFSWRVMLIEKAGFCQFKIKNNDKFFLVDNSEFLTPFQEKQMSFQPDFIIEFAHYLGNYYSNMNNDKVRVFVDCFVTLNGRESKRFVDQNIDLYSKSKYFNYEDWLIPMNEKNEEF